MNIQCGLLGDPSYTKMGASQLQDLEGFMNPFQIFQIGFVVAGGGFISYYNHQLIKLG